MTLISGDQLIPDHFFSRGRPGTAHPIPEANGSSCDLTIGGIITQDGRETTGPFVLKPGHMVQVVSAEVFSLKGDVTGHVTYKTELTRNGIWALTVGIVDPGWNGPISTTLLNFSRVEHAVSIGSKFLRVSFFQHSSVSNEKLRACKDLDDYFQTVKVAAATRFPATFLDQEKIATEAGDTAFKKVRAQAFLWFAAIAVIFSAMQIFLIALTPYLSNIENPELSQLRSQVEQLEQRISDQASQADSSRSSEKVD